MNNDVASRCLLEDAIPLVSPADKICWMRHALGHLLLSIGFDRITVQRIETPHVDLLVSLSNEVLNSMMAGRFSVLDLSRESIQHGASDRQVFQRMRNDHREIQSYSIICNMIQYGLVHDERGRQITICICQIAPVDITVG